MKLEELLAEDRDPGTFVGVRFTKETVNNIVKFQEDHKIPNPTPAEELHVTLIFSRKSITWDPNEDISLSVPPEDGHWKEFPSKDKETGEKTKTALTWAFKSEYLQKRNEEAMDDGATSDHKEYIPHVTFSYDSTGFDSEKLPKLDFDLELDKEYVTELDLDWTTTPKSEKSS